MKKIIYILLIPLLIITFFTCTVSDSTGLIKVENYTYLDLTNVKIGDTSIAWIVAGGAYANYWYYQTITGELTTEGIPVHPQFEGESLTLEPGYYVYITAKYMEDGSEYVVIDAEEYASDDPVDLTD
jgi:hypothetical protein